MNRDEAGKTGQNTGNNNKDKGGPGDPNFLFEHQQCSPAMVVYQISMLELSIVGVCELSFCCELPLFAPASFHIQEAWPFYDYRPLLEVL